MVHGKGFAVSEEESACTGLGLYCNRKSFRTRKLPAIRYIRCEVDSECDEHAESMTSRVVTYSGPKS